MSRLITKLSSKMPPRLIPERRNSRPQQRVVIHPPMLENALHDVLALKGVPKDLRQPVNRRIADRRASAVLPLHQRV